MAKSWQYGRWRVMVLQLAMWVIFASSLGLAAYIDHRRSAALNVRPGETVQFGRLAVRVPAGWDSHEEAGPPLSLTMEDFDNEGPNRGRRQITIKVTQEQQSGPRKKGPAYYLETMLTLPSQLEVDVESYSMLGQSDGALVTWRGLHEYIPNVDPSMAEGFAEPGVYACVLLPDGLTVTVQVRGEGAYGPTARRLLRKMADSIRVTDKAPATSPAS